MNTNTETPFADTFTNNRVNDWRHRALKGIQEIMDEMPVEDVVRAGFYFRKGRGGTMKIMGETVTYYRDSDGGLVGVDGNFRQEAQQWEREV